MKYYVSLTTEGDSNESKYNIYNRKYAKKFNRYRKSKIFIFRNRKSNQLQC